MTADLTVDMRQEALKRPDCWGIQCSEHPKAVRTGLTQRHAQNAMAKHNRDHHAEPSFNLSALASEVLRMGETSQASAEEYGVACHLWETLTGLDVDAAAQFVVEPEIVLAMPPF